MTGHRARCAGNTQRQCCLCLHLGCPDCPAKQRDLGGMEERDGYTERVGQILRQRTYLSDTAYCLVQIPQHTEKPSKIVIGRYCRITRIERRHGAMAVGIVKGKALLIMRASAPQLSPDIEELRECQVGLQELHRVLLTYRDSEELFCTLLGSQ